MTLLGARGGTNPAATPAKITPPVSVISTATNTVVTATIGLHIPNDQPQPAARERKRNR
jgi:hypothetical protein